MKLSDYPKLTIIMRGYSFEQSRAIFQAMNGLEKEFAVEVTMNTSNALTTIQKLNEEFGSDCYIGAGTVLNYNDKKKPLLPAQSFF